ncbi:MAG: hypothetical protein Nkreftii_003321 [Candidatus Nitrospira kreftii]|uniref:Uncharacterized protein n=1 Tax=Candidatus Nitrospira kreftii TaxID=2652173 RepID=A0A7S8FGR4_9BACT|nr:MAG: hypothetical protein Nkreftii_003321 [Candidatus Nitrospira kreftii]
MIWTSEVRAARKCWLRLCNRTSQRLLSKEPCLTRVVGGSSRSWQCAPIGAQKGLPNRRSSRAKGYARLSLRLSAQTAQTHTCAEGQWHYSVAVSSTTTELRHHMLRIHEEFDDDQCFPLCRSITVPASFNSTVTSVPSARSRVFVSCSKRGKDFSPSAVCSLISFFIFPT